MNLPWRVERYDARVYIIDGTERRLTEIEPGQRRGQIPTVAEKLAIAQLIVDRVNG